MITIIDYGCGNLHSLKYALASIGLDSQVSCCEADILGSSGVILPGVGAFGAAMESIRSVQLDQTIHSFVGSGKKLMGICLGMHLLASSSNEFGEHHGLGVIPGRVVRLANNAVSKVPNVGWFPTRIRDQKLEEKKNTSHFYYTHSYEFQPSDRNCICATTTHGGREIAAVVHSENVIATQFHPEKSGGVGLKFLRDYFCDF